MHNWRNDSLTFYVINPTSLVKPATLQQLVTHLSQFKIGIAIITEIWFSALHTDGLVKFDSYNLHRKIASGRKVELSLYMSEMTSVQI